MISKMRPRRALLIGRLLIAVASIVLVMTIAVWWSTGGAR